MQTIIIPLTNLRHRPAKPQRSHLIRVQAWSKKPVDHDGLSARNIGETAPSLTKLCVLKP